MIRIARICIYLLPDPLRGVSRAKEQSNNFGESCLEIIIIIVFVVAILSLYVVRIMVALAFC